jgi:hypothetical protein
VISNVFDQSPMHNHLGQRHKLINASRHSITVGKDKTPVYAPSSPPLCSTAALLAARSALSPFADHCSARTRSWWLRRYGMWFDPGFGYVSALPHLALVKNSQVSCLFDRPPTHLTHCGCSVPLAAQHVDNTTGIATGNDPESIYAVMSGKNFNGGCCFVRPNAQHSLCRAAERVLSCFLNRRVSSAV